MNFAKKSKEDLLKFLKMSATAEKNKETTKTFGSCQLRCQTAVLVGFSSANYENQERLSQQISNYSNLKNEH